MTIQTYPDLRDSFADNNVGAITAQNIVDLLDSVGADSAVLEDTTGSTQTANVTTFTPIATSGSGTTSSTNQNIIDVTTDAILSISELGLYDLIATADFDMTNFAVDELLQMTIERSTDSGASWHNYAAPKVLAKDDSFDEDRRAIVESRVVIDSLIDLPQFRIAVRAQQTGFPVTYIKFEAYRNPVVKNR